MQLTQEQIEAVQRLKQRVGSSCNIDPDFCVLCPDQCKQQDSKFWYCPMLDANICDICCQFDMDDQSWPRGKWPEICDSCGKNKGA